MCRGPRLLSSALCSRPRWGDKTQLAVIAFTATNNPWLVFFSASAVLVASTALAAPFGQALLRIVPAEWLRLGCQGLVLGRGVVVLIDGVHAVIRR
jgi:putative Ca2+/H+ antiporter (TMEM165/GDT1 family)